LVKNTSYNVTRSANNFSVSLTDANSVLAFAELNLVQYEHVLIFDNSTVFNDVIYRPELGNRQYRLKLVGQKTANWDGSLYAPGFVYNSGDVQTWQQGKDYLKGDLVEYKNLYYVALKLVPAAVDFDFSVWKQLSSSEIKTGLLPNWSTIAVKPQSYYDSYSDFDDENVIKYSHGLIGYKPRQYLADLGLSDTTQMEFYKGYIRQKGSANAVNELTRAEFNNLKSAINYYEEWAVRVGEYGALDSNPYIEIVLDEKSFSANPTTAEFVDDQNSNDADGVTVFNRFQLYRSTNQFNGNIALNRDDSSIYDRDIPTAGYVNLEDVDATIFDLSNYTDLNADLDNIGTGYKIWVAKDFTQDWNVYRVTETDNTVIQINNILDGLITFTTATPHNLEDNEIFLVRNFGSTYDGFYQVYNVIDLNTIAVVYYGLPSNLDTLTTLTGSGLLLRLDSMRFTFMEDARVYGLSNPIRNWKVGDRIWIDDDAATNSVQGQPYDTPDGTWKVYEKTNPWNYAQTLEKSTLDYGKDDGFGSSIRMSADGLIVVAGSPFANTTPSWSATGVKTGRVIAYDKNYSGEFVQGFNVTADAGNANVVVREYGNNIDMAVEKLGVGAPGSYGNVGFVFVYNRPIGTTEYQRGQVIVGNVNSAGRFGSSISFEEFGNWLYIGSPDEDTVYVYGLNKNVTTRKQLYSASGSANTVTLNFTPDVANVASSLLVTISNRTYIPDIDYTLTGSILTFTETVPAGTVTIIQQPYFTPVGEPLVGPADSEFGYDLDSSLDGAQLAISAPGANVMVNGTWKIGAGSVYVYDRVIEAFNSVTDAVVGSGSRNYEATGNIGLVYRVTIDDIEVNDYQVIANAGSYTNTISFINPPPVGKMIFVETNKFNLLELLIGIDSLEGGRSAIQDGARFGTSLTICSNNCAIYVGAPKYTADSLYNQGAVWKFHHRGRLYGTNTGYTYNPVFTPGDTIRLDNFEVAVTGRMLPTVLANGTNANILAVSGNIVANVGDYITQTLSGANVTVLESNWPTGSKTITVSQEYNTNIQLTLNSTITASRGDFLVQNIDGVIANVMVYADVSSSTTVNVRPIMGSIIADGTKLVKNGSYMVPNVHVTTVTTFTSNTFTYGADDLLVNDAAYISNDYVTNTASWSNVAVHPMASLDSFVKDINDAGILGVSAVNENGFFRLDSDRTVAKNLLRNLSGRNSDGSTGVSDIYASADMAIFAFMQIIVNPFSRQGEYFGSKVILARNAYMLVIASERGTTQYQTTFDSGEMVLDDDSTVFFDAVLGSGSVYIYELYDDPRNQVEDPGRYAYCQQLTLNGLEVGDRFGADIDIVNGEIIVSAPGNDDVDVDGNPLTQDNAGKLYLFSNPARTRGWNLIRYQEDKVDPDTVSRMYLYDNQSNTILTNLEFIDPAKGKILGQAEQDLTYKTEYDPAIYNRGNVTTTILNSQTYWGENQVNQVWWNLSQVRFVDYEQGSLAYRAVNWGRLFPGSSIEVCEWVESTVLPSQYVGAGFDGVPKYSNDEAYVEITYVDPTTNIITSKYYFWVTNKTSLTNNTTGRTLPVQVISDLISNPKSQGIAYTAVIKSNAFIVYNVSEYLSATDTILHLDYDLIRNTNLIHSEYELLQEGNRFSVIPDKISNKMIDSLSGVDSQGAVVPDSKLSVADRYGISSRPRQSMFVDRLRALSDLVEYVNAVLAQKPIARQYNLSQLDSAEPIPLSYTQNPESGAWDSTVDTDIELAYLDTLSLTTGYRILVKQDTTQDNLWTIYALGANKQWSIVQVQSYSTNQYWEYIDWYADGFGPNEQIEYVVDTLVDALRLPASIGDEILVKVNNTALGGWNLLTVLPDGTFSVVGIQNGTIQIKTAISDFANNGLGFGNQGFASARYDQNPNIEIRYIIQALRDDIFIGELDGEYNKLFFVMMNYLFNEQKYVDWIFKTSFISVTHNLRELTQPANYIKDNQTYYEEYINEVKPYITKIREYLTSYTGTDEFKGSVTDFDLAPYYDAERDIFRSPSGESGYAASDSQLWATGYLTSTGQLINQDYPQWYSHRTYSIGSIVITDPGAGYTADPEVIITGGGVGVVSAKAIAEIDFDTGRLLRITVTSPGSGYTQNPTIEINGSAVTDARAYALLTNEQVRSFDTTLKFDRISYTSSVVDWSANTLFTANTIVSYNGTGYKVLATITTTDKFNPGDYELYFANAFTNANDRIMAYYAPQDTMPAKDLNQLVYGIEYPGVQVQGLGFNQQPGFPGTTQANITFSSAVTTAVGNVITQSEADITLKLNYPITANVGEYITQTIVTPYWGNVFSSSNAAPYFWANTGTTANGRVYSSVTSSEQVSLVYVSLNTFTEGAANITIAGSSAVRSIWGNVVVDPTTGFSSNVTPWKWSNVGVRPEATIVSGTSYVGTPITDASLTVTKVWAANKVTGIINNTTDWVIGNSSITFGNIKVDTLAVGNVHVTAVEYISNNDINPFDTGSFDNVEYDEDGIPLSSEDLLDTVIRSTFLDSTLGTRPEDINISGGAYIDSYGSHAPEELVPGIIYDTLDMKVYTKIEISANVDAILGHRIFKNMVNNTEFLRISGDYTTTLTQPLALSDTEIHVANVAALATPTPSQEIPGVIFIGSERITYWTANVTAGTLGQIRRGTQGTAAQTVHSYGAAVIDASIEQLVPNVTLANVSYTTANTYTITDYIAYWIRLNTNVSANIGDTIAQTTSGVDAKVTGVDADSNLLLVNFTNSYRFNHTNVSVQLSGNITANVGDFISQPSTGANLTVVDNYTNGANILATYNTINLLSTDVAYVQINDAWPSANVFVRDVGVIPLTGSNIAINGVHNANIYPMVTTIAGNVTANGTATFGAGTIYQQTRSWYNVGISSATDGGGYEQATTEQVAFLKASPATYSTRIPSIPDAITTEDAINITTEDGNDLYEE
jgi:hypothetical protein